MIYKNTYDDGYDQGLVNRALRRDPILFVKKEPKPADPYAQGKEDAERYNGRDETKSALIKDNGYQKFLMSIAEIHGHTNIGNRSEILSVNWRTGGMCGGSCWGDKADLPVTADDPKELTELDRILEKIAPNTSFLAYKNLCNDIIHSDSYIQNEYYGNYYTYAVRYVLLSELYLTLKNRGMI
jgi:hypothetical protein